VGIFIFSYLQVVAQTYASERVARDLRNASCGQDCGAGPRFIQQVTPAKLLTNLTSDVDAVKMFVSQAVASLISSAFLISARGILLLSINWKLGIGVLATLPIIGATFSFVNAKSENCSGRSQEAIDWLNKVINESILGSALIRLVNSQHYEYEKFVAANTESAEHQPRNPAADCRSDSGHHFLYESRDPHDPHGWAADSSPGVHESGQLHGVQPATLRF